MSFKLNLAGKMFLGGLVMDQAKSLYDQVKNSNAPERFNERQISIMKVEIFNSAVFQNELGKFGATTDSVIQKLGINNLNSRIYYQITGKTVPNC